MVSSVQLLHRAYNDFAHFAAHVADMTLCRRDSHRRGQPGVGGGPAHALVRAVLPEAIEFMVRGVARRARAPV